MARSSSCSCHCRAVRFAHRPSRTPGWTCSPRRCAAHPLPPAGTDVCPHTREGLRRRPTVRAVADLAFPVAAPAVGHPQGRDAAGVELACADLAEDMSPHHGHRRQPLRPGPVAKLRGDVSTPSNRPGCRGNSLRRCGGTPRPLGGISGHPIPQPDVGAQRSYHHRVARCARRPSSRPCNPPSRRSCGSSPR